MKNNIEIVKQYNRTEYFLNGKLHREDGPACEWTNGDKSWWIHGKLHREDGAACEWIDGTKKWYIHGKLHRNDGPARKYASGYKEYWYNGHRIDEFDDKRIEIDANLSEIDIIKYLLMIQSLR